MKLLDGKNIVVTGAGRGIGKAIAETCAKEGANVVVVDIDAATCDATAKEIGDKYGVKTIGIACNVAKRDDTVKLADTLKIFCNGVLYGLVNNAGVTRDSTIKKMTEEQWDTVMAVNLKSMFLMSQSLLEMMTAGGSIVNISSVVGKSGNFGQCNYSASKAGVVGFSKSLAKELASPKKNVRVNAIQPGFIKTPMTDAIPENAVQKLLAAIPMERMGQPEDIANACLFLLSDMSKYITGAVLEVTGGMFM